MANDKHRFPCPCCHKRLEYDTTTGKVREVTAKQLAEEKEAAGLEKLLESQRREAARLDDAFTRATEDTRHQADRFEEMLRKAKDKAKQDKDKKPPNPFDLD